MNNGKGPVTVCIARRVKPGREAEYEDWVSRVIATASKFPGHIGVDILKPSTGTRGEYVTLNRFDSYENQLNWEESPERENFLKELDPITEGDTRITKVSGLEFWFSLPEIPANKTPNRHKMALVLSVVVFVLVLSINLIFGSYLQHVPLIPRVALVSTVQVLLLTYLVMPRITSLLKGWIYSNQEK